MHRIAKALLREGVAGKGMIAPGRLGSPWRHPNEGSVALLSLGKAGPSPFTTIRAQGDNGKIDAPIPEPELAQIAEETSQTERRAADAERELVEWKKVRFMEDRVGEEFAALVLNPTKFGLFVELTDLFVEGLVPIDTLRDDRYVFRESTHEIVGERLGRRFRAGDRVQVILDRILAQERRLQFSIAEEGLVLTGRTPGRKPAKVRKARTETSNPRGPRKRKPGRRNKHR